MRFGKDNRRASKLTGEQVVEIRERYAYERGCTQPQLARDFGVTVTTIANIVNGLTWQNMPGQEGAISRPPPHAQPPATSESSLQASMARTLALLGEPATPQPVPSLYEDPPPYSEPELSAAARTKFEAALAQAKQPIAEQTSEALGELLTVDQRQKGDQK